MIFNLKRYTGNYAMLCRNKEESISFCTFLHNAGRRWQSGDTYIGSHYIPSTVDENTYYCFNSGTHTKSVSALGSNYKILEWSDYMDTQDAHLYSKILKEMKDS